VRDRPVILAGLAVVLLAVATPVWLALVRGRSPVPPVLPRPEGETACVRPVEYMRTSHMLLLKEWQQQVVREGVRTYATQDGRRERMSLTGSCLRCHRSKADFCDRCHTYVGISPNCGNCHLGGAGDRL